ncbi:MAG: molybdopterin-dependent oxidoreductase [Acidimicrobiales bacterium]
MGTPSTVTLDPPAGDSPGAPAPSRRWWQGSLAGLVAAGAALGVAQLVSGLIRGTTSPVVSVGEWVIDHVPVAVKDLAIRQFGTNDKPMLIAGTVGLLAVFAVVIGASAVRRLWIGIAGVLALGVIGVATAVTRPSATAASAIPATIGTIAAVAALVFLLRGSRRPRHLEQPSPAPTPLDRRRFLVAAAAISGGAVAAGGVGRFLAGRFDVSAVRSAISLPRPRSAAAPLPPGADLGIDGITPFVTANDGFYRVDTALSAPQVSPADWSLTIKGMVDRRLSFSYDDLLARADIIERDITLVCISNEVGGPYAGNARWLGVPLADLLREAGVQDGADQLVSRSVDGWTAGTPTRDVLDGRDALVAFGMNGEPLPVNHGFPVRLVIPGVYGYNSATKWLTELELTTFGAYDAYWASRGYAQQGPLKTLTRIDTPRGLADVPAGRTAIGGVAWAVHRGIDAVEVRVDDGPWMPARLGDVANGDTWRQWVVDWDATPGSHTLTARSTDGNGDVQPEARAEPLPDGASGWHSVVVIVS